MARLLFISFFFPPRKAIASVRTFELAKGMVQAGNQLLILTSDMSHLQMQAKEVPINFADFAHHENVQIIGLKPSWRFLYETDERQPTTPLRKLLTRIAWRLSVISGFDPYWPWALEVQRFLTANKDNFDAIIVSGGPFTGFIPATRYSKRTGTPLALDYRDLWNGDPHSPFRLSTRCIEKALQNQSSVITTVSKGCAEAIAGPTRRQIEIVTNGISSELLHACANAPLHSPQRSIIYVGSLYPPARSIDPVFSAFARASSKRGNLRFTYYGPNESYVRERAAHWQISDLVTCKGQVPHLDSLIAQRDAYCTVVITSTESKTNKGNKGILTGKLFEALAVSTRVLVISPPGSDVRDFTDGMPSVANFSAEETTSISDYFVRTCDGDALDHRIDINPKFSWQNLALRFNAILNDRLLHAKQ
jgi:glycosyltransferase involved in cell wall biosynthesis